MKFKPPTHIAEGGVKSSIEDFIYDLPKEAIEELKVIMKEKYGSSRTNKLIKIRGKYKLPTQVMGYPTVQLINDYFNTYFGAVNEERELDEGAYQHSKEELKQAIDGSEIMIATLKKSLKTTKSAALKKEITNQIEFWKNNIADAREDLGEATIPDHAEISDRNLVKKTITFKWNDGKKWVYEEVPEDEAPGFYARAGTAMKARKTDKFGNLLKAPVVATHSIDDVMATNLKSANDLVATIAKKKTGTKFEIYGKKNGKEYTVNIRKSMKNDAVVYLTTGDRLVELRPTAAGLQVVDKASNRVLLSNGNDMIWESLDLIDVGRMVIEIFEENIC